MIHICGLDCDRDFGHSVHRYSERKGAGEGKQIRTRNQPNLIPTMQQVNAGRGNADAFVAQLKRNGFVVREGAMAQFPLEERCCPDDS